MFTTMRLQVLLEDTETHNRYTLALQKWLGCESLENLQWAQPVARYATSGHSMALSDSR